MDILDNLTPEMAVDYIEFLNSFKDIPKRGKVSYGKTSFNYVLLDDIMSKAKENRNFGVFFLVETLDANLKNLQVVFVHKTGVVLPSRSNIIDLSSCRTIQEKGAQLTYEKRYLLASYLGIAADPDTDGMDEKAQIESPMPIQQQKPPVQKNISTAPVPPKKAAPASDSMQKEKPAKLVEQKEELSSGGDLSEKYKRATAYTSVKYEKTLGELTLIRLMEIADSQDESEQTRAAAAFLVKYIEHLQKRKSLQFHQEELGDLTFEQLEEVTKSSLEPSSIQKAAKMLLRFYGN